MDRPHRHAIGVLRALGAVAAVTAALSCADTAAWRLQTLDAVAANGAYNLGCPRDKVRASEYQRSARYSTASYFADGCGQRAVYEIACKPGEGCHFEMVARFSTVPGPLPAR